MNTKNWMRKRKKYENMKILKNDELIMKKIKISKLIMFVY